MPRRCATLAARSHLQLRRAGASDKANRDFLHGINAESVDSLVRSGNEGAAYRSQVARKSAYARVDAGLIHGARVRAARAGVCGLRWKWPAPAVDKNE